MHHRRFSLALLLSVTVIAAPIGATVVASAAASPTNQSTVDPDVTRVLGLVTSDPGKITDILADNPLTSSQLGQLLTVAGTDALDALLSVLSPSRLTGALGTVALPALTELLTKVVTGLSTGDLRAVVAALDPAVLSAVLDGLGLGALGQVVDALTSTQIADLLLDAVDGVIGVLDTKQLSGALALLDVQALTELLSGLAADRTQLAKVLRALTDPVLAALPTDQLQSLLVTLTSMLDGDPAASVLAAISPVLDAVSCLLGADASCDTAGPGPNSTVGPSGLSVAAASAAGSISYRASLGRVTISRNRRQVRATITCPATASQLCTVKISGQANGRSAFQNRRFNVAAGTSGSFAVSLASSVAKRLRARGGTVSVTARTIGSTQASVRRSASVKAIGH